MDENHIKILKWFEKELLLSLNIQCLLVPLRQSNLITSFEEDKLAKLVEDEWTGNSVTTKAKESFLRILKTKGPDAFTKFLNVLRNDKEHPGHKSLYAKLVQHKGGNLPRWESEPADSVGEKLIMATPIRHNSLIRTNTIERIREEGVLAHLENISERLQSLEQKIDALTTSGFSEQNVDAPYAATRDHKRRTSEIAGLPSLPPVTHIKASQNDQSTPLDAHRLPSTLNSFEITCSFKSLQIKPLAFNYKMCFVPQLSGDGSAHSQVEICDLEKGVFLETAQFNTATSKMVVPSLCPNLLRFSGNITIFGSNSKKVGLYSLDTSKNSWVYIDSSEFSFQDINFENCVCASPADYVSDNLVVATVLQGFVYFYLFTPNDNNVYWRSAKLSLPQHICDCKIQSCVVISRNLFCSLLSPTHLLVYQIDLNHLYQSANSTCLFEPKRSWILENRNIEKCFLSSLNAETVTIMVKKTDKLLVEFSELEHFNSGSLEPIISFSSAKEVFYATVIPDTTNVAIVYSDSNVYKMCLLNVSKMQEIDRSFDSFLLKFNHLIDKADFSEIEKAIKEDPSFSNSLPKDTEEKMLQAIKTKSSTSFINALKPIHCNWLNVSILKEMAEKVDTIPREATELVSQFTENVWPKKLKEVMWPISSIPATGYTEIKYTWNKNLDDVIIENLIIHQEHLALVLHVQQHSLVLQRIESGVEMHWAMPSRLVDQAMQSAKGKDIASYDIFKLEIDGQLITLSSHYNHHHHHAIMEEQSEVNVTEPEPVSETVANKEYEVFRNNYAKLTSTLTDIDHLLPHFVERNIIGFQEESNIMSTNKTTEKIKGLLLHISGPLEGGDNKGFYTLLEIMKSKGKQATKDLAENMEKQLNS